MSGPAGRDGMHGSRRVTFRCHEVLLEESFDVMKYLFDVRACNPRRGHRLGPRRDQHIDRTPPEQRLRQSTTDRTRTRTRLDWHNDQSTDDLDNDLDTDPGNTETPPTSRRGY